MTNLKQHLIDMCVALSDPATADSYFERTRYIPQITVSRERYFELKDMGVIDEDGNADLGKWAKLISEANNESHGYTTWTEFRELDDEPEQRNG